MIDKFYEEVAKKRDYVENLMKATPDDFYILLHTIYNNFSMLAEAIIQDRKEKQNEL